MSIPICQKCGRTMTEHWDFPDNCEHGWKGDFSHIKPERAALHEATSLARTEGEKR